MRYTNAKGKRPHPKTIPPDKKRCQAYPNMLNWSPFSLGPKPKPQRCENKPVVIAVENKRRDGKIGSMSLCVHCRTLLHQHLGPKYAKEYMI